MSTHNVCFYQEIRQIIYGYPLLSAAMHFCLSSSILLSITEDDRQPVDQVGQRQQPIIIQQLALMSTRNGHSSATTRQRQI